MTTSPQGLSDSEMDFEEKPKKVKEQQSQGKATSKNSGDFSDEDNPYAMFEEMIQPKVVAPKATPVISIDKEKVKQLANQAN